jgi:hypothetical protein
MEVKKLGFDMLRSSGGGGKWGWREAVRSRSLRVDDVVGDIYLALAVGVTGGR